jgi:hypothetical protein
MAMSATAAAKRRRAGGLLSSPMLQPPHVLQAMPANRLISSLQSIQQQTAEQPSLPVAQPSNVDMSKGLTLQQVITLLDTRIINLEKTAANPIVQQVVQEKQPQINYDEIQSNINNTCSQVESILQEKIESVRSELTQTSEELISNHINEYNHRFEMLATELLNVKNLLLELQSYTMGVNKLLFEERINVFSEINSNQFKTTEVEVKLDGEILALNEVIDETPVEPETVPLQEELKTVEEEVVPVLEEVVEPAIEEVVVVEEAVETAVEEPVVVVEEAVEEVVVVEEAVETAVEEPVVETAVVEAIKEVVVVEEAVEIAVEEPVAEPAVEEEIEEVVVEEPAVEEPVVESAVVESVVEPVVESAVVESVIEEPVVETVVEEVVVEKPVVEELVVETVVEEVVVEEPVVELAVEELIDPVGEEPAVEEVVTEKLPPVVEEVKENVAIELNEIKPSLIKELVPDTSDFIVVPSKAKRGKNAKKQKAAPASLEQEISLPI